MRMTFSSTLYPKTALLKAAYAFTDRAYLHLDADGGYYIVELTVKPDHPEITRQEFENEMLCQAVRHEVYQQTKTVRELLTARALASTVISESGIAELPETGPDAGDGGILTDWFEVEHGSDAE